MSGDSSAGCPHCGRPAAFQSRRTRASSPLGPARDSQRESPRETPQDQPRSHRGFHRTVRRRFPPVARLPLVTRRRDLLPGSLQLAAPHPAVHHTPGPLSPGVLGSCSLADPRSPHLPRIACGVGGPLTFPCRFRAAELAPLLRLDIPGSGKHRPHARAWVMRRFRPPMAAEDFLLQGTRQLVFDSTR